MKLSKQTTFISSSAIMVFSGLATNCAHASKIELNELNESNEEKPNIVLIIADDSRYLDFGCYGSPDAITPNIDRLASQGLKFNNFFQATAMSSPTRHSLLTGYYPVRSGAYPNHTFIKEGITTLPTYLKNLGYRVAMQGKKHIAPINAFPFEYLDNKPPVSKNQHVNLNKIEDFISEVSESKEPFFLYIGSTDPHTPWNRGDPSLFDANKLQLSPNLVDTEATRNSYVRYLAEINKLDSDVGIIDNLLEEYGLAENTIFIFTSEQGYAFPFAKWTCYDEGVQTGFIVRWDKVIEPGRETDAICEYVDVTPTLIEIAGGTVPSIIDGKSFLPVLKGDKDTFKEYSYSLQTTRGVSGGSDYYGIRSVRSSQYRYILNLTPEVTFDCWASKKNNPFWGSWLRKAENDLFAEQQVERYQHRPREELYDVSVDPFMTNNLAYDVSYSNVKNELKNHLENWMKQQGDEGQETELKALEHQVK